MPQSNINTDREREAGEARAELPRRAEAQGVRPLSFDEMLGDLRDRRWREVDGYRERCAAAPRAARALDPAQIFLPSVTRYITLFLLHAR